MKIEKDERGIERFEFDDVMGERFCITHSPKNYSVYFWAKSVLMICNKSQVRELVAHLSAWLETGSFEVGE